MAPRAPTREGPSSGRWTGLLGSRGAAVPVLPFAVGLSEVPALIVACVLVGMALLVTGAIVGVLSGGPPLTRALRQLAIGCGAAAITFAVGSLAGATLG